MAEPMSKERLGEIRDALYDETMGPNPDPYEIAGELLREVDRLRAALEEDVRERGLVPRPEYERKLRAYSGGLFAENRALRADVAALKEAGRKLCEYAAGFDAGKRQCAEDLAAMTEERDDFRKRLADMTEERKFLRLIVDGMQRPPCKCATGPWIKGKPEVMDGRLVLVDHGTGFEVFDANGKGFDEVTRHAEINRTEGGTE